MAKNNPASASSANPNFVPCGQGQEVGLNRYHKRGGSKFPLDHGVLLEVGP